MDRFATSLDLRDLALNIHRLDLLQAAIDAQGGLEQFEKIRGFETVVVSTGTFFALKGYPRRKVTGTVFTKDLKVIFSEFYGRNTDPTLRWIWTPHRVWTERPDGIVVNFRDNPKASFKGLTRESHWDDFHMLYFGGYALWNYMNTPFHFTWPGIHTRELEDEKDGDQVWRVLEVTYPENFPTHGRVQKLLFDREYRLRRLDYSTEVGTVIPVNHYLYDHRKVDGILLPFLRRAIRPPEARVDGGPSAVLLDFVSIKALRDTEPESA